MNELHFDIETYSENDIVKSGVYKYTQCPHFAILILCYKLNDGPIITVDLAQGEQMPQEFIDAFYDPDTKLFAHNAQFERLCFEAIGMKTKLSKWVCSAVKAAYCGLPMRLAALTKVLDLGEDGKLETGTALIRYFSIPCKPTKANGGRTRNLPEHDPEKWELYKQYCVNDVRAECAVLKQLEWYSVTNFEQQLYSLDQHINDRGIGLDSELAQRSIYVAEVDKKYTIDRMKELTGLENPNSVSQLKQWLEVQTQSEVAAVTKDTVSKLLKTDISDGVREVLNLRAKASKTSVKKYQAMIDSVCKDMRVHGLLQFNGAGRTGRWAGRLIQVQNLPQNHLKHIETDRQIVKYEAFDTINMLYGNIPSLLSQLIRTALIGGTGKVLGIIDYAAIEARVLAWLAGEQWRIDVFNKDGWIYEASASMMFGVPVESIKYIDEEGNEKEGPNYHMRANGKVAELALGYGGGYGAMMTMGAEKMGMTKPEIDSTVVNWRSKSPYIVQFWREMEQAAKLCIINKKLIRTRYKGIEFDFVHSHGKDYMTCKLPSGRKLTYADVGLRSGKFGPEIIYKGLDERSQWVTVSTYGGKLTENIVQAVARDLLADALVKSHIAGFDICMHVHDEIIVELNEATAEEDLKRIENIMGEGPEWAEGLPLKGVGEISPFYRK